MGFWGTAAWENDGAADWFGHTFDVTGLAKQVEVTLNGDPEDDHEEIRAAAYVLVVLGRVFIWPGDNLDHLLVLAANKLEMIRDLGIYQENPGLVEAISQEIEVLRSRISSPSADS